MTNRYLKIAQDRIRQGITDHKEFEQENMIISGSVDAESVDEKDVEKINEAANECQNVQKYQRTALHVLFLDLNGRGKLGA